MHSIERIYPPDLDPASPGDQNALRIHLERYEFAARHLCGEQVLDMACGCGYGSALLAERHPDKQVTGVDIDPAVGTGREIAEKLLQRGVLVKDTHGQTIRIAPPLVVRATELDWAIEQLRLVLAG